MKIQCYEKKETDKLLGRKLDVEKSDGKAIVDPGLALELKGDVNVTGGLTVDGDEVAIKKDGTEVLLNKSSAPYNKYVNTEREIGFVAHDWVRTGNPTYAGTYKYFKLIGTAHVWKHRNNSGLLLSYNYETGDVLSGSTVLTNIGPGRSVYDTLPEFDYSDSHFRYDTSATTWVPVKSLVTSVNSQSPDASGDVKLSAEDVGAATSEEVNYIGQVAANADEKAVAAMESVDSLGSAIEEVRGIATDAADMARSASDGLKNKLDVDGTAVDSSKLGGVDADQYAKKSDIPAVSTTFTHADANKAADAKAVGDALAGKRDFDDFSVLVTEPANVHWVFSGGATPTRNFADEFNQYGALKPGFNDPFWVLGNTEFGDYVIFPDFDDTSDATRLVFTVGNGEGETYQDLTATRTSSTDTTPVPCHPRADGTYVIATDDAIAKKSDILAAVTDEIIGDESGEDAKKVPTVGAVNARFATKDEIPDVSDIVPSRLKNDDDTERADGSGNIYGVVAAYNGGTLTRNDGRVYTNCTVSGTGDRIAYKWSYTGGSDYVVYEPYTYSGVARWSGYWNQIYQYGLNPMRGDVLSTFEVSGRSFTHVNEPTGKTVDDEPSDRFARVSELDAKMDNPEGGAAGQVMTKTEDGVGWAAPVQVLNVSTGKWHRVIATSNSVGEIVLAVDQEGKSSPVDSGESSWTFDLAKTGDPAGTAQLQDGSAPYASYNKLNPYCISAVGSDRLLIGSPDQGVSYVWGFEEGHAFEVGKFETTYRSRTKGHPNYKAGAVTPDGMYVVHGYQNTNLSFAALPSPLALANETDVPNGILLQANPFQMQFSADGKTFFYKYDTDGKIRSRRLRVANNPLTMSDVDDGELPLGALSGTMHDFCFAPDGKRIVVVTDKTAYCCELGGPWDVGSGMTLLSQKTLFAADSVNATAVAVNDAGTKMIVFSRDNRNFYEFDLVE